MILWNEKEMMNMPKNDILKDGQTITGDEIVLGGETIVITGEIIVDENNRILEIKHN